MDWNFPEKIAWIRRQNLPLLSNVSNDDQTDTSSFQNVYHQNLPDTFLSNIIPSKKFPTILCVFC